MPINEVAIVREDPQPQPRQVTSVTAYDCDGDWIHLTKSGNGAWVDSGKASESVNSIGKVLLRASDAKDFANAILEMFKGEA